MNELHVPFLQSYWVVPGQFLAGCYPGSEDAAEADKQLKALLDHGLRSFIDLMEPEEKTWHGNHFEPYARKLKALADGRGIETAFYRYGIEDFGVPARELMTRILDAVDRSIEENRPAYVHCRGGIGRTGMVVGCYLARHGYASGEGVLTMIHDLRRLTPDRHVTSPEVHVQREMVQSWSRGK